MYKKSELSTKTKQKIFNSNFLTQFKHKNLHLFTICTKQR